MSYILITPAKNEMSAAAGAGSPAGYPPTDATTRLHRFIETSGEINEFMKMHVINLAERGLRQVGKRLYGAKITVMGLAYKKSEPRESPAIKSIKELMQISRLIPEFRRFVPLRGYYD